jgi:hypothetical protein
MAGFSFEPLCGVAARYRATLALRRAVLMGLTGGRLVEAGYYGDRILILLCL